MCAGEEMVQSVGVKNGRIESLGTNENLLALRTKETQLINLEGRLVLPGFNDSHMHLLNYGIFESMVDLGAAKSWEEIESLVGEYIRKQGKKPGEWVFGKNWNQENWIQKEIPTREALDKISSEHPIILTRVCTHIVVANTAALKKTGIFGLPVDIDGGKLDVGADGLVNGIVRENAVGLLYEDMKAPPKDVLKEIIVEASNKMLEKGITSVQTDDLCSVAGADFKMILSAFEELSNEGRLPVRINEQARFLSIKSLSEFLETGRKTGSGNDFFKIGPLKLFVDGSLGARTALMRKPYEDDKNTSGIGIFEEKELAELVAFAHKNKMQIAIHCIGDKAVEMAVKSFENILINEDGVVEENILRHGIVHCQITDKELLNRMGRLSLVAYIQPVFVQSDYEIVEQRVGKEMAEFSYGWKTMLEVGVEIAGGSDCPVEKFDILPNIYCAVTRKSYDGKPTEGWNKKEKLTVEEAVKCFTTGGAYVSFEENEKGTISIGKLADLVVLNQDIFNLPEDKIKDVEIDLTMLQGEIRWISNVFSGKK